MSVVNYQPTRHISQESEDPNSTTAEVRNLTDKNVYSSFGNKNRMEYIRVDIAVSLVPQLFPISCMTWKQKAERERAYLFLSLSINNKKTMYRIFQ
jgi:hypothetical protein